jgi:hypothetical protein
MIKHDHENEFTKIFLQKKKSEIVFLDHISHFEIKGKTRYTFSQQIALFERNIFNLLQKKRNCQKRNSL